MQEPTKTTFLNSIPPLDIRREIGDPYIRFAVYIKAAWNNLLEKDKKDYYSKAYFLEAEVAKSDEQLNTGKGQAHGPSRRFHPFYQEKAIGQS
jgi:hypothetical protein